MIDQQSALFFFLSRPIFPLGGKWDDLIDYSELVVIFGFDFKILLLRIVVQQTCAAGGARTRGPRITRKAS